MILPGFVRRMYLTERSVWGFAKVPGGWRADYRRKGGRIRSAIARTTAEALRRARAFG